MVSDCPYITVTYTRWLQRGKEDAYIRDHMCHLLISNKLHRHLLSLNEWKEQPQLYDIPARKPQSLTLW